MNDTHDTRPARAREAVARGDHRSAYDLLMQADAASQLAPEDLPVLAEVAYAIGDVDTTMDTWERVHTEAVRAKDPLTAATAAMRMAMHFIIDTGLLAPVRVWTKRADLHLVGFGRTPVHAWLAVPRLYERLLSGDLKGAREWARQAIELGTAHDEPAAAAFGRVGEARCLILEGNVAEGLELLDEAAAFTLSGEVDPLSVGLIYCELVCAWQGLAQYDRADELTAAMERWCARHQTLGSVHGRCRLHRAEILRLRGPCEDAEREALRACEELRPLLRRERGWPLTELGTIRLQKGDLAGAEDAFLEAHEAGWEPQPGLALLRLAQGDVDDAASSIAHALEHPHHVPSKELPPNTKLRRAPMLAAQVEIAIAAGDVDTAHRAADELGGIAAQFDSKALHARAAAACGRVGLASGEADAARHHLERAVQLWTEIVAPYEAACVRLDLAKALRAQGDDARADLEAGAARSAFERLGASRSRASAAPTRGAHRSTNVFRSEGDHWCIVFDGTTVRLRDLKGLRYLAQLLGRPGHEFHAIDLVAAENRGPARTEQAGDADLHPALGDAGPVLDTRAKEEYRRRLAEIDEDIEEARMLGDDEREARAADDRDFIIRELSGAIGLGGRDRRANSPSERARVSVTRAIRLALEKIGDQHPALGAHLDHAVQTGTYCAYRPDPRAPVRWRTAQTAESSGA